MSNRSEKKQKQIEKELMAILISFIKYIPEVIYGLAIATWYILIAFIPVINKKFNDKTTEKIKQWLNSQ